MRIRSKKAQLGVMDLPMIGVIIILVFLLLSFGALILNDVADLQIGHGVGNVTNESDTSTFNVLVTLDQNGIFANTYNLTRGDITIERGNFTLDATLGTVNFTNVSGLFISGDTLDINSSYDFETDIQTTDFNISKEGTVTLLNISTLIPTAGTVIGAAIIIGMLLIAFAFSRFGLSMRK